MQRAARDPVLIKSQDVMLTKSGELTAKASGELGSYVPMQRALADRMHPYRNGMAVSTEGVLLSVSADWSAAAHDTDLQRDAAASDQLSGY